MQIQMNLNFLVPSDDGENEAIGNATNSDSLILDLYFLRKENWWYIQYISFIFPFFRVSFDGL